MIPAPTFDHEQLYWNDGISLVAGIDEAGMGALAGPVVAGAVVFNSASQLQNYESPIIRDSKTMSAAQRERAAEEIKTHARAWAVGEASVEEITELNIRGAVQLAMARALYSLSEPAECALVDGNARTDQLGISCENIIKGDAASISIAAASILAKVHRDAAMVRLDAAFPAYGFASHKGYGAQAHLEALKQHGPTAHHRPTYAPVRAAREQHNV